MKRFMLVCALAVAILSMSEQKASAWKKFGFNIGLNVNTESADNSYLWGAFRDGPVPGSKGHGLASTITKNSHGGYPENHGGGFNPHYGPGDFGGHGGFGGIDAYAAPIAPSIAPVAPVVPGHTAPNGHGGATPLPLPANMPQASAPAPMFIHAAYWSPAQNYYWPGN